jgi:hypothetical protein
VGTAVALLEFYRAATELGNLSEAAFLANAGRAYPNLYFYERIENQFGRFSVPYLAIRASLSQALADLNDHLPAIIAQERQGSEIVKRFNAMSKFSISPDSPNTNPQIE